jgi:RHS repeat-associated protein
MLFSSKKSLPITSRFLTYRTTRKLFCLAVILSLLILPVHQLPIKQFSVFAANSLNPTSLSLQSFSSLLQRIFQAKKARHQKLSAAQRQAQVSTIKMSGAKYIGYAGDCLALGGQALDAEGNLVHGVRLTWRSSDPQRLQIDDMGIATLNKPGVVKVMCQAGTAESTIAVLIRPGLRPPQSDGQWDEDHQRLLQSDNTGGSQTQNEGGSAHSETATGNTDLSFASPEHSQVVEPSANTHEVVEPSANDSASSSDSENLLATLAEKLLPTAHAQSTCTAIGDSTDYGYDELYTELRNLTGTPRYRPIERTRLGQVLPDGSNFELSLPLYGLSGRSLGASLTLNYNSRVWSRHGSAVTYNAVNGFPFAGFSLGFGRIFTYGSGASTKYIWIAPDGTRHYLGTGSDTTNTTYQTTDGTHITFVGSLTNGGSLYYNDGTKVTITLTNNRLLPTRIRDANGNFIAIVYKTYNSGSFPWRQAIDNITDTQGRYMVFNYDAYANLASISVPAFDTGTQTLVQFDYQCNSVSNSFSGLTVENRPTSSVPMLRHVYFPATHTGYKFDYSAYGMIYKTTLRKDMSIDVDGVIADGTEKAAVEYNYPTTASSLTDVPAFSQRSETASDAPTSTYSYASNIVFGSKTYTITQPDSSKLLLTVASSGAAFGLMTETQIQNSSSTTLAKTVYTYTTDGGSNTQIQTVTNYDDANVAKKVDISYDIYGNVTDRREYGYQISGAWQVRRRDHAVYKTDSAYVNAYLRSLLIESNLYDAKNNTNDNDDDMITKSTRTYDDYNALGGMEVYPGQAEAANHDSSFDATVTVRGNVTGETRYKDVANSLSITKLKKIDKYGNVVKEQLSCCNEIVRTMDPSNGYATVMQESRGGSGTTLTTEMETDFNTGLLVSQTDAAGKVTAITYDTSRRLDTVTYPTDAVADEDYDDSDSTTSESLTYEEDGSDVTIETVYTYDGWGRVISAVDGGGGQVNITYDTMGREWKKTNPFQAGHTPGGQTVNTFDALGRTTTVTLPDGNTVQTSYNGATVTVTDQVNRKIKRESDGLGRLIKVYEQDNATGNLTQETSYTYSLLDQLIESNQGGQYRLYKQDSLGRLLYENLPEMTATINDGTGTYWTAKYTYTDFDAIATKTDARGVVTTNSYDTSNRLTGVSYNVGSSGVPATPSVTYTYDTGTSSPTEGELTSVSISGQSSESYSYNGDNQLSGITRTIGAKTYATSYERTTAGQLSQLTYASGRALDINHNSAGRLSSIINLGDSTNYLSNATYNYAGQVTGYKLGSDIVESFGYDSDRLQLTSQTTVQNSYTRMSLTYNYTATSGQNGTGSTAGNSGQLMSYSGTFNGGPESAYYAYDLSRRLVSASQTTNGLTPQRRYENDRWNNRTAMYDATSGGNRLQDIELEQSSSIPSNRIKRVHSQATNVAAASNGATASASSTYHSTNTPASAVINGDRKGVNWGSGGGWMDNTASTYPDWLQVNFSGSKSISEIDVFTIQDSYSSPSEPTEAMTFSNYGLTNYAVQYWDDPTSSWQTVSGGSVTGNNKVWKKFTFSSVTTNKIRVSISGTADGISRLAEVEAYGSYVYDANGNLTNDGAHTYTLDAENRIVSVDSGTTATYAYDHQNRRIKSVVGGTTRHYVWEGNQCIAEHNGSSGAVMIDYIFAGSRMIAREDGVYRLFFLSDKLSARAAIIDNNGSIVGRQATLPYGEELNLSGQTDAHLFTSYRRDSETNTDYAVNRQYHQGVGRFNRVDPVEGSIANPQSLNRYTYVQNDPVNMTDPDGLIPCTIFFNHNKGDYFQGRYNQYPFGSELNYSETNEVNDTGEISLALSVFQWEPTITTSSFDRWYVTVKIKERGYFVRTYVDDNGKTVAEREDVRKNTFYSFGGGPFIDADPNNVFKYLQQFLPIPTKKIRDDGARVKLKKVRMVYTYAYDIVNVTGTKGCARTFTLTVTYTRGIDNDVRFIPNDGNLSGFGPN